MSEPTAAVSPDAPYWETPVRNAKGQVTRNPEGVLHLEVQVGDGWWSLRVPEAVTPALEAAIEAAA